MGFRFRKSWKILPGVRLNLSRRGIGTSVGIKGFHVSSGPSGKQVTTSIPGTGIYHVKRLSTKSRKKESSMPKSSKVYSQSTPPIQPPPQKERKIPQFLRDFISQDVSEAGFFKKMLIKITTFLVNAPKKILIILAVLSVVSCCCIYGFIYTGTPEYKLTATANSLSTSDALATTQAFVPSSTPTKTKTPTLIPSQTPTVTPTQTSTQIPVAPAIVTAAPVTGCNCAQDYDCSAFSTNEEAQNCFVACGGSATYNWSNLDRDNNGKACESLP